MSMVVEAAKSEKENGKRRSLIRKAKARKVADPPAETDHREREEAARGAFHAALPVVETAVALPTAERHKLLRQLVDLRRDLHAARTHRAKAAARLRLMGTESVLVNGCIELLRHVLFSIEGRRAFDGLPARFPQLGYQQLWVAAMGGLYDALEETDGRKFEQLLFDSVFSALNRANCRASGKPAGRLSQTAAAADSNAVRWEPTPAALKGGVACR